MECKGYKNGCDCEKSEHDGRSEPLWPDFKKRGGLIVAIIQCSQTKKVLMHGYLNPESLQKTLETGEAWFWSTSRNELWHKGATSGNVMKVKEIWLDCDKDCVLISVEVLGDGNACHCNCQSCFSTKLL